MGEKQGFHKMELSPKYEMEGQRLPLHKQRKCRLCFCVCSFLLVSLAILAIVMSQTIFKFRDPKVSLSNVEVQSVSVNFDLTSLSTLLSVVVSADVQVNNPNYYDFAYENITVLLMYHEEQVGEVELGAGTIRSQKIVVIPAVVTVEAVKILLTGLEDITTGVASVVLNAVIPGRVNVAHVYEKHVTAMVKCDVDIFIANQTLKHSNCKQSIKM